jgi:hypothetical protein
VRARERVADAGDQQRCLVEMHLALVLGREEHHRVGALEQEHGA